MKFRISGTYEDALKELIDRTEKLAAKIEVCGGLIGHIKSFAHEDARGCLLSLTELGDIQAKHCIGDGVLIETACIVFGLSSDALEEILKQFCV
jgi:hypothetical protein